METPKRTTEQIHAIVDTSVDGTRAAVLPYAVTLIDSVDGMSPSSGTIFQIQGRYFIATAGHCIPQVPNGRLWLVSAEGSRSEDGYPAFLKWSKSRIADVGVLEVAPEAIWKLLSRQKFASLDDISLLGTGDPESGTVIVGSPSEHASIRKTRRADVRIYLGGIITYWSMALPTDEWPRMKGIETADLSRDIFFPYPYGEPDRIVGELNGKPATLPKAPGMSGGGVWDQGMKKGKLWSASEPKIFGVVSSWSEVDKYLRATQIVHWLRLTAETFPELAAEIFTKHPAARP